MLKAKELSYLHWDLKYSRKLHQFNSCFQFDNIEQTLRITS